MGLKLHSGGNRLSVLVLVAASESGVEGPNCRTTRQEGERNVEREEQDTLESVDA